MQVPKIRLRGSPNPRVFLSESHAPGGAEGPGAAGGGGARRLQRRQGAALPGGFGFRFQALFGPRVVLGWFWCGCRMVLGWV